MSKYCMTRGWQDHEMFDGEPYSKRDAWEWLISNAAWKKTVTNIKGRPVNLKRGQLSFSIRFLAEKWDWGPKKVRVFLKGLSLRHMISTEKGTGQLIISICNYNQYQFIEEGKGTGGAQFRAQQRAQEGHKEEEGKEDNKKDISKDISQKDPSLGKAIEIYREVLGSILPVPRKLTKSRKAKLTRRLEDLDGLDGWKQYCLRIRGSPFLCGDNDKGWKADIDFMLSEEKMNRTLEGKYDEAHRGNHTKNGKYTVGDASRAVLAELGIAQDHPDNPPGGAVLRDTGHIRQDTGAIANPDESPDPRPKQLFD